MKNQWLWWLGGLLILSLIVIGLSSRKNAGNNINNNSDLSKYPVTQDDHILGDPGDKVVIVEYADFECPACKVYASLLNQIYTLYKGRVALVFRHFPLIETHDRALVAAKAAEAAGAQDKFFEMLDLLYQNQEAWVGADKPENLFVSYAKILNLDLIKFQQDSLSQATENFIRTQRAEAQALKLSGTPSFFINGKFVVLPQSVQEFQKIIEAILAKTARATNQ